MTDDRDGSVDRPRAGSSSATWPSAGSPGASCSSGSPRSARPPRWPRSSRPARAGTASTAAVRRATGRRRRRRPRPRRRRRRPPRAAAPTPVPTPEKELFVYNWADYIGRGHPVAEFEDKYGIKVKYDDVPGRPRPRSGQGQERRQGRRLRHHATRPRPTSRRWPATASSSKWTSRLIPNIANLGAEWAEPGLRPGQRVLGPVHVVDDRRRLRTRTRSRTTSRAGRPSGTALQGQDGHARRPAGVLRGGRSSGSG